MNEKISQWLNDLLAKIGFVETSNDIKLIILVAFLFILCIVINYVAKQVFLNFLKQFIKKTKSTWDDILVEEHVFDTLSHLAPAFVIYATASIVFIDYQGAIPYVIRFTNIYVIWVGLRVFLNFFNAIQHYLDKSPNYKDKPVEGFVQLGKLVVYIVGVILVLSVLMQKSPTYFLTALGTIAAVLMLVFKDTILGLVASIQIAAHDMIRMGDWIEMPKYGADGSVIEINLTTIKIQNWDKTISTVPIYSFISGTFKNWRGMSDSGGRRIKRSFSIKMSSIRICTPKMLEKFKRLQLVKDYIDERSKEIADSNKEKEIDVSLTLNGRQLTNIGIFRVYMEAYLKNNPNIHKEMTCMVRQLSPTPQGLPLEMYAFSAQQEWITYEGIIGDLLDHLLAAIPFFELEIFEEPTGADFRKLQQSS